LDPITQGTRIQWPAARQRAGEAPPAVPRDQVTLGGSWPRPDSVPVREAPLPKATPRPDLSAPLFMESTTAPTEAERPLMLGPIPEASVLPVAPDKRTRALLNSMIVSAPSVESRRTVVLQLQAFGIDAVSLVHNHGTQIIVVPNNISLEDAWQKFGLPEDTAKDLKSDTAGMFRPGPNVLLLREDHLSRGFSAQISASVARHEFAHALEDAMGKPRHGALYGKAMKGEGGRPVTSYARTDAAEYFAESTAAYLTPAEEFGSQRGLLGKALFTPYLALSGLDAPTREQLEDRDPNAARMLDDLFASGLKEHRTSLSRNPRLPGHEAWLWRAHQVDPSDERIRIQLLEIEKKRAADPAPVEARIQREYQAVEARLDADTRIPGAPRKDLFKLLHHYYERADRAQDPTERAALETRAIDVATRVMRRDGAEIAGGGGRRVAYNYAQDYEWLANQSHAHKMGRLEAQFRAMYQAATQG